MSESSRGVVGLHLWSLVRAPDDWALLDAAEQARATAFRFERHRDAFVAGRAGLRRRLAAHLGSSPRELVFAQGPHGKPELEGQPVRFNLSHSGALALLAIGDAELGLDLEAHREVDDLEGLARQCFSPGEREVLFACPEPERMNLFYRGWVRKEALLKLSGEGMRRSPRSFEVGFGPAARLKDWPGSAAVVDLPAPPGFSAALAVIRPEAAERIRWLEPVELPASFCAR